MQRSRLAQLSDEFFYIDLRKHIEIPTDLKVGLVKCRVVYGKKIEKITYAPYIPNLIRSLKLVQDNSIDYTYKYQDRNHINDLYEKRGDSDDIIIVKNGMLTDSSYSNIALLRDGVWHTPSTCLLRGTRRQQLIDQGRLIETEITVDDLNKYDKLCLINAMIGLNNMCIDIPLIN